MELGTNVMEFLRDRPGTIQRPSKDRARDRCQLLRTVGSRFRGSGVGTLNARSLTVLSNLQRSLARSLDGPWTVPGRRIRIGEKCDGIS